MAFRVLLLVSLCFLVKSELVNKKYCNGVDPSACRITSVDVERCSAAPRFCRMTSGKRYPVTVRFVPNFTANDMVISTAMINPDLGPTPIKTMKRACADHLLVCPVEPHISQTLQFDFIMNLAGSVSGSRPIKVHFWNAANETEACCFTFKAKPSWHQH